MPPPPKPQERPRVDDDDLITGQITEKPNRLIQPAFAFAPLIPPTVAKTIELGLALYAYFSLRNGPDAQTIVEFNARAYGDGENPIELSRVQTMTREEVKSVCNELKNVQTWTDEIAASVKQKTPYLSPQQHGTSVHHQLDKFIKKLGWDHLNSEVSLQKIKEEAPNDAESNRQTIVRYGDAGTIRIDVFEDARNNVVCVYDIKPEHAV